MGQMGSKGNKGGQVRSEGPKEVGSCWIGRVKWSLLAVWGNVWFVQGWAKGWERG